MIKIFAVYCFKAFSCCQFFISSCRCGLRIYTMDSLMDEQSDIPISCEEIVRTRKRTKDPNPKWYKYLLYCLDEGLHNHMLSYVSGSDRKEFIVIFIDRKNKDNWKPIDISLFKDLDKHIGIVFNRQRSMDKIEEDVKVRFKSNMYKCVKKGFIEKIGEEKIERYKIVKKYKIIWRPSVSVGESSNDGKIGGNKGKSHKRVYKKNGNKEIKTSRRNFQGKMENPRTVPHMGNHQIMNFESIPEMGDHQIINFESIPEMGDHQIMDFEDIPQICNHQVMNSDNVPPMSSHEIKNFESMSKEVDEKNEIVQINHFEGSVNFYFADLPQEGKSKIENFRQEDNSVAIPQNVFEEKDKNYSHYLWLSKDSQIKIDGSVHVNSEVSSLNFKTQCPEGYFSFENDPNIYEHEDETVKIFCINTSSGQIEYIKYPEISGQIEYIKYPMISGQIEEEKNLNEISDGCFENQENQYTYDNGKYVVEDNEYPEECEFTNLESDPFMCSGQFERDLMAGRAVISY